MTRYIPDGKVRVTFVPADRPDPIEFAEGTIEFSVNDFGLSPRDHPLTVILAEDPTPWTPFTLNDGRTGQYRTAMNGDKQIIMDGREPR